MRGYLNPAQKGHIFDKAIEIVRVAHRGNRTYERIMSAMQDIIDGRFAPDDDVTRQLFVSPEQQLKNVRHWNSMNDWGFSNEDFEALGPTPNWPSGHLCAVVLVPYFKSRKATYEALTKVMFGDSTTGPYAFNGLPPINWPNGMQGLQYNERDYVRHCGGAALYKGLQWQIVSLGANRGQKPWEVEGQQLAAAETLAAAAHFPKWVKAMNGLEVPIVWLGGYKLMFDVTKLEHWWGAGRVGLHPALYFNPATGRPTLYVPHQGYGSKRAAVPAVLSY